MALTLISLLATVLVVAGLISSRPWASEGPETNRDNHDDHIPSSPKRTLPLIPYHMLSYYPMKYYYHHHVPQVIKRHDKFQGRTFDTLEGTWGGPMDRTSDFYYILPILLVIGLGSFLIPIISTFFTAMVTSGGLAGCCGRRKRRHESSGEKPFLLEKINDLWESFENSVSKFTTNFTLTDTPVVRPNFDLKFL